MLFIQSKVTASNYYNVFWCPFYEMYSLYIKKGLYIIELLSHKTLKSHHRTLSVSCIFYNMNN